MPQTVPCQTCGFAIRFTEEDRGFERYCDSCGHLNAIPSSDAATAEETTGEAGPTKPPEPADPQTPADPGSAPAVGNSLTKSRIFSADGLAGLVERVLRYESCLCGAQIPVHVEDVGSTLYCPQCSAEIQVGDTLEQDRMRAAKVTAAPSVAVREPRFRLLRSRWSLAAMLLIVAAGLAGGYFTWRNPDVVRALASEWTAPLQPRSRLAQSPAAGPRLEATEPGVSSPQRPDAEISLPAIEALLKAPDPAAALIQAQIWREILDESGIAADDPRRKRLAEVLPMLEARVAPPRSLEPPACIEAFHKCVQSLSEALRTGDLAGARGQILAAEKLLAQHAEELGPHSARFFALKARLLQQERQTQGTTEIRKGLDQVPALLEQDRVTEALEYLARAKFLAMQTPLTEAEFKDFDARVRRLGPTIRFARGKRAVEDARRCDQARDTATRDREARRAMSWLPGLPESQIKSYVAEIQKWIGKDENRAERQKFARVKPPKASRQEPASPADSPFARQIDLRERYEDLLEAYGDGRAADVVPAALELEKQIRGKEEFRSRRERAGRMLFDVLEPEISGLLTESGRQRSETERFEKLSAIRQSMARLEPWKEDPRFKALDGLLRQQGDQLARKLLESAQQKAADDKLSEALQLLDKAQGLAAAETAQRIEQRRSEWQAEVTLRADNKAEQDAWQRIQQLRASADQELELYGELLRYVRRFSTRPHADEVRALGPQVRQVIEKKLAARLAGVAELFQQEEWEKFRQQVVLLKGVEIPPPLQGEYEKLRGQLEELKLRADEELQLLRRHSRLLSEGDVLAVYKAVRRILALDPEHEEAKALLIKARGKGALYAEKLLHSVSILSRESPSRRSRLERAIQLDPEGPHGDKARELLKGAKRMAL